MERDKAIDILGYKITQKSIGKGGQASISMAEKDGVEYAAKIYDFSGSMGMSAFNQSQTMINQEIETLKSLDHENIMKLHDSFMFNKKRYLICKYYKEGNLHDYIERKGGRLLEEDILRIYQQLSLAMFYAESKSIAHRDIKPANILVDGNNFVIADFGLARIFDTEMKSEVGTPYFVAPQIFSDSYTSKCDVWSLGVTLYFCAYGTFPWKTKVGGRDECGSNLKFDDRVPLSPPLKKVITQMLQYEEKDRISWKEIVTSSNFPKLSLEYRKLTSVENIQRDNRLYDLYFAILSTSEDFITGSLNLILSNPSNKSSPIVAEKDCMAMYLKNRKSVCDLMILISKRLHELAINPLVKVISSGFKLLQAFICLKVYRLADFCRTKGSFFPEDNKDEYTHILNSSALMFSESMNFVKKHLPLEYCRRNELLSMLDPSKVDEPMHEIHFRLGIYYLIKGFKKYESEYNNFLKDKCILLIFLICCSEAFKEPAAFKLHDKQNNSRFNKLLEKLFQHDAESLSEVVDGALKFYAKEKDDLKVAIESNCFQTLIDNRKSGSA